MYEDIKLKGTATSAYQGELVDGFISAIKDRFEMDMQSDDDDASVMSATVLLNTKKWPKPDSDDFKGFIKRFCCQKFIVIVVWSLNFHLFILHAFLLDTFSVHVHEYWYNYTAYFDTIEFIAITYL